MQRNLQYINEITVRKNGIEMCATHDAGKSVVAEENPNEKNLQIHSFNIKKYLY